MTARSRTLEAVRTASAWLLAWRAGRVALHCAAANLGGGARGGGAGRGKGLRLLGPMYGLGGDILRLLRLRRLREHRACAYGSLGALAALIYLYCPTKFSIRLVRYF